MPIDLVAAIEQRFGQVRADEAGGSGDDDALFHGMSVDCSRLTASASVDSLTTELTVTER